MSLHAVILAGGSGTRFWPLSRARKPKQFLALVTGRPLIVETLARVEALCPPSQSWVVCGNDHVGPVRDALPQLPKGHVIAEPQARNTAPAIALACVQALRADKDATLCILPSDHHVARPEAFRDALALAARACQGGDLLTLGIQPTRPETGYGYLRRGGGKSAGVFAVEAFVEKPDAKTAQAYIASGSYLWNAGIFIFRAEAMLDALRRRLPLLMDNLDDFSRVPSISIDHGVMEPESREGRIATVPGDFGWSDVGSFAALPEVRPLDARGNALSGDALAIDSDGSVVMSEGGRLVAVVGVRDLCIVDAGDVVLVVPRERAQDVRAAVEALKGQKRDDKL